MSADVAVWREEGEWVSDDGEMNGRYSEVVACSHASRRSE
jgi:hypothetical protein